VSAETFAAMLRRLRVERGLSQSALAGAAAMDSAYVNRLERAGETQASGKVIKLTMPGRDFVLALALALDLSYAERDRMLFVAGLAPELDWQTRAEDAEAALQAVREAVGAISAAVEPTLLRTRSA
jgi:transcriptional regulator with XRE-family HTH domain